MQRTGNICERWREVAAKMVVVVNESITVDALGLMRRWASCSTSVMETASKLMGR